MQGKCGEENFNKKQNPLIISRFIFDYCGLKGITVEHLIPFLTLLDGIKL